LLSAIVPAFKLFFFTDILSFAKFIKSCNLSNRVILLNIQFQNFISNPSQRLKNNKN